MENEELSLVNQLNKNVGKLVELYSTNKSALQKIQILKTINEQTNYLLAWIEK